MMNSLCRVISTGLVFLEPMVLCLQTTKPGPGSWEEPARASAFQHLNRPANVDQGALRDGNATSVTRVTHENDKARGQGGRATVPSIRSCRLARSLDSPGVPA